MNTKKTLYIWVLIVLEIINIPLVLMSFFDDSYIGSTTLGYVGMSVNIIGLVIVLIWLHRAFLMKKDLIRWTNINFGFGIFTLLFSGIVIYVNSGNLIAAISGNLLMVIIFIAIWLTFVKHLKTSLENNRIQLS